MPELVYPVFGMCLGYPDDTPDLKPRLPMDVVYKTDYYDETKDEILVGKYNQEVAQYYIDRTDGKQSESWSERCARLMMEKTRDGLGVFLQEKGFNQTL